MYVCSVEPESVHTFRVRMREMSLLYNIPSFHFTSTAYEHACTCMCSRRILLDAQNSKKYIVNVHACTYMACTCSKLDVDRKHTRWSKCVLTSFKGWQHHHWYGMLCQPVSGRGWELSPVWPCCQCQVIIIADQGHIKAWFSLLQQHLSPSFHPLLFLPLFPSSLPPFPLSFSSLPPLIPSSLPFSSSLPPLPSPLLPSLPLLPPSLPSSLLGPVSWQVHWQQLQHALLQADAGQETDHPGSRIYRLWILQLPTLDQVSWLA